MADSASAGIVACGCVTPFGDAEATVSALLAGRRALEVRPVLGRSGGDPAPLAVMGGELDETLPPRWLAPLRRMAAAIPAGDWGSVREPVIVTSSNFGVGSMHAFTRDGNPEHLRHGAPFAAVARLAAELGWGENTWIFSHACVTAHLGLAHAARLLQEGLADRVLVVTFDFVSPFVAGGFSSLKILNGAMPAPYAVRDTGAIGLGDGAAFAVLSRAPAEFRIEAHALHNEMHHFTGNRPDGAGFAACGEAIARAAGGRRVWVKGHGTGTLEAGRLEAEALARAFPGAPLVSWKGALGHTLGSCGLVELALAVAAIRRGTIPGTVGSDGPCFTDTVARAPFALDGASAAVLASNAFGGAQAALLLTREAESAANPAVAPAAEPRNVRERFIRRVQVEIPPETETAAEARQRLAGLFPRGATRRMTHLGMLLGAALDGIPLTAEDAIVYATTFAETRALEDYLRSFPTPSPLLFQTSIHPAGVQQVLVGRQQPVGNFWPLAGRSRLVEQALLTALIETSRRVFLLGGEEKGTWLLEHGMASDRAFAFALEITDEADGAIGRVRMEPGAADGESCPSLPELADALAQRRPLAWSGPGGGWSLAWQ